MTLMDLAKAAFDAEPHSHPAGHVPVWADQPAHLQEHYASLTRAILTRLREPGEQAVRAGKPFAGVASESAAKTFAAMIDAILEEG